ncbi:hypothetical protein FEP14_03240 [Burkholderia multivorans]|nr:hypothetical protein [Burkholderia multivorans]MDR9205945.1 hypothetical protein [Burkholderia multivorans]MDR9235074.1 hypothetical protein [Burkholderia multivorans]MDR9256703.1 hypothetical protein [Burkholderia multivorans]
MPALRAVDRHRAERFAQRGRNAGPVVAYFECNLVGRAIVHDLRGQRHAVRARARRVVEQDRQDLAGRDRIVERDAGRARPEQLELHVRMPQAPVLDERVEPLVDRLPARRRTRAAAQARERRRAQHHLFFEHFQVGLVAREPRIVARGIAQLFGEHRDRRQRRAHFVCNRRGLHAERDRALVAQQPLLRVAERRIALPQRIRHARDEPRDQPDAHHEVHPHPGAVVVEQVRRIVHVQRHRIETERRVAGDGKRREPDHQMPRQHGRRNRERRQIQRHERIRRAARQEQQRRQRTEVDPQLAEQLEVRLRTRAQHAHPRQRVEDDFERDDHQHRRQRQMHAEIRLHDADRHELADDREIAQPEQMTEIDAPGGGDSLHPGSLPVSRAAPPAGPDRRARRHDRSPPVSHAARQPGAPAIRCAISAARHSGHRHRTPGADGGAPGGVGIDAHQHSNGCVCAPQSKPRPQRAQRTRRGTERAPAAESVMAKIAETGDAAPYATSIARQPDFARRPIGRCAPRTGAHPAPIAARPAPRAGRSAMTGGAPRVRRGARHRPFGRPKNRCCAAPLLYNSPCFNRSQPEPPPCPSPSTSRRSPLR